jgi:hypothetical protein
MLLMRVNRYAAEGKIGTIRRHSRVSALFHQHERVYLPRRQIFCNIMSFWGPSWRCAF